MNSLIIPFNSWRKKKEKKAKKKVTKVRQRLLSDLHDDAVTRAIARSIWDAGLLNRGHSCSMTAVPLCTNPLAKPLAFLQETQTVTQLPPLTNGSRCIAARLRASVRSLYDTLCRVAIHGVIIRTHFVLALRSRAVKRSTRRILVNCLGHIAIHQILVSTLSSSE